MSEFKNTILRYFGCAMRLFVFVTLPLRLVAMFFIFIASRVKSPAKIAPGAAYPVANASGQVNKNPDRYYIDSGSNEHVVSRMDCFKNKKRSHKVMETAGGVTQVDFIGSVGAKLLDPVTNKPFSLEITDVLHMPNCAKNLLSFSKLLEAGIRIDFDQNLVLFPTGHNAKLYPSQGLYYIQTIDGASYPNESVETPQFRVNDKQKAHFRFGHMSDKYLSELAKQGIDTGLKWSPHDACMHDCKACNLGKLARGSHPSQGNKRAARRGELIVTDVWGPFRVPSYDKCVYAVAFTDSYSRLTKIYFMQSKSEFLSKFIEFHKFCASCGVKLQTLKSDNDTAIVNDQVTTWCAQNGIRTEQSGYYMHEANGISERIWRTLLDMTLTFLLASKFPLVFWVLAMRHANYIRMRMPHSSLDFKTPYEMWYGKKPSLSHVRVFGCTAYAKVDEGTGRKKLQPKSVAGFYVGHDESSNMALVFVPSGEHGPDGGGQVKKSGDVKFVENFEELNSVTAGDIPEYFQQDYTAESLLRPEDLCPNPSARGESEVDTRTLMQYDTIKGPIRILEMSTTTRKGVTIGISFITSGNQTNPFWIETSKLLGAGREIGSTTYFQFVSKYIKIHQKSNDDQPVNSKCTVLWREDDGKQRKYPGIICAFDPNNAQGQYYNVVFFDGSSMNTHADEFVEPPTSISSSFLMLGTNWMFDKNLFDTEINVEPLGPHTVDACCEKDLSNSLLNNGWSDAFNQDWRDENVWCNVPFDQIHTWLKHILKLKQKFGNEINVTILVPVWKSEAWYKLIKEFDIVKTYPTGSNLFTAPHKIIQGKRRYCGHTKWPVHILRTKTSLTPNISCFAVDSVPQNQRELERSADKKKWIEADTKELDSLRKRGVYKVVDMPTGKPVMGSRVVRRVKYNADGSIEKYKSRVVAQGFTAIPDVHFFETFAPVVQITALRLLLALCVKLSLKTFQIDFETAFLNADLKEEIYIRAPEGHRPFKNGKEQCWKLIKSLYGLKQAPRDWNEMLVTWLLSQEFHGCKFEQSKVDTCMFTLRIPDKNILCILCLYVDDLSGGCNDSQFIQTLISRIKTKYAIEVKDKLHWLLQLEINESTEGISINQSKYVNDILERFHMSKSKTAKTPLPAGFKINSFDAPETEKEKEEMKNIPYRQIVGSLLWLARCTRPDISAAVSILSRYCTNPSRRHYEALLHVLRYLKGTKEYCIKYSRNSKDNPLCAYSDSDWAGDQDERKSISGYIIFMCNAPLDWFATKQNIVALSSTEAEYISLSTGSKSSIYLRNLLCSIGFNDYVQSPIMTYGDNDGSVFLGKNPKSSNRTKHIDIKYHHIRDSIAKGLIKLKWIDTKNQLADILTKPLSFITHNDLLQKILSKVK